MGIQAKRYFQIRVMRFTEHVVLLEDRFDNMLRNSVRFEPLARYLSQRFQAVITAKYAKVIFAETLLPQSLALRCPYWILIFHVAIEWHGTAKSPPA